MKSGGDRRRRGFDGREVDPMSLGRRRTVNGRWNSVSREVFVFILIHWGKDL